MNRVPEKPKPAEDEAGSDSPEGRIETFISEGNEIYLVAGIEDTGKTQLLGASPRISFLAREGRAEGRAQPTLVGFDKRYSYDLPGRKVLFVDASGERFRTLYPAQRRVALAPTDLQFLRTVTKNIRGLVLVLDLDKLWHGAMQGAAQQEQMLRWILRLFRFLYFGGAPSKTDFEEHIENTVASFPRRNRLPFPVQLIFSKADLLVRRSIGSSPRWPDPRSKSPLMYAHRMFPDLMREMRLHAKNFRVDFAQAVGEDPETGQVSHEDWDKLGVDALLDWLVNSRGGRFAISSHSWLWLQEFWDDTILKRKRWIRQPPIQGGHP